MHAGYLAQIVLLYMTTPFYASLHANIDNFLHPDLCKSSCQKRPPHVYYNRSLHILRTALCQLTSMMWRACYKYNQF